MHKMGATKPLRATLSFVTPAICYSRMKSHTEVKSTGGSPLLMLSNVGPEFPGPEDLKLRPDQNIFGPLGLNSFT